MTRSASSVEPLVIDLDVADREDAVVDVVVLQLVRAHEHLRVRIVLPPSVDVAVGTFGTVRDADARRAVRVELRGRGLTRSRSKTHGHGEARDKRHPPAVLRRTSPGRAADRSGHYPSSWYRSTTKPVSPPASTGNHAAAAGCSSSALLKSSVTLDRT